MAIYDPPGPTFKVVHEENESSPTAAIAHALARCNASYYSSCEPVGVSTTCISVTAGPGVEWVFATGPDASSAAANVRTRATENGWDGTGDAITSCSWGD
ncbi:DUF4189 domain-containing protein [Mycobacterium sp.]|uniref:DUF4189 domain-containing protein n=1 Tax=Mycobacterium sp. TaxID=1785 RepID=UPI003BB153F6